MGVGRTEIGTTTLLTLQVKFRYKNTSPLHVLVSAILVVCLAISGVAWCLLKRRRRKKIRRRARYVPVSLSKNPLSDENMLTVNKNILYVQYWALGQ